MRDRKYTNGLHESMFYCDVGFKAVLRKIRALIVSLAIPLRKKLGSFSKRKLRKFFVRFFDIHVLEREINSNEFLVNSQMIKIAEIFTDSNLSRFRNRTSSFSCFNKMLLRPLEANPLYPEFRQFLLRHESIILADFKENRFACRRAAFRTLLFWI